MGYFIGTDVGGTFTDLWITSGEGDTRVFKSPTTPDVLGGVMEALELAAAAYGESFERLCAQIERFGHGTTVGLNALLTGKAARTAVLTTRGFGDTLEIGRLRRQTSGMNETEYTDAYLRNRHRLLGRMYLPAYRSGTERVAQLRRTFAASARAPRNLRLLRTGGHQHPG